MFPTKNVLYNKANQNDLLFCHHRHDEINFMFLITSVQTQCKSNDHKYISLDRHRLDVLIG